VRNASVFCLAVLLFVVCSAAAIPARVTPNPAQFAFSTSQTIDGATVTCSSVDNTATYTECRDLQKDSLYFPNGVSCGPMWSSTNSQYSDTRGFCQALTGSTTFEVYYDCTETTSRATWYDHVWGTFDDNGYTRDVRCYYGSPAPLLSATKTASAENRMQGEVVTWTVVITNAGNATQPDNSGDEFVDVLPAGVELLSATASDGTAVATIATNTVTWNGSLAASASVNLTIRATITAEAGTVITNSGTVYYDSDLNASNESNATTDDPSTTAAGDATAFAVAAPLPPVPALSGAALAALALLLVSAGLYLRLRA
jgi:uncharacterized repeat protein (TIGR01451 family)